MNNQSVRNSLTFCDLLGVLFITLKLLKVINWSWWLVLAPIYGPFVILILLVIVMIFIKIL